MRITTNKLRVILSCLACSTADLLFKNSRFGAAVRTSVLQTYVFPTRPVDLSYRWGCQMMATECSMKCLPHRGAMRQPSLKTLTWHTGECREFSARGPLPANV